MERMSDQKKYITDIEPLKGIWHPEVNKETGLKLTFDWLKGNYEV
jgi:hypothetical protein